MVQTLAQAAAEARRLSRRYGVWYVRRVQDGYASYAHHSGTDDTVRTYSNGERIDA